LTSPPRIEETLWINEARRALRAPQRLSACLFTGTDKLRRGYGNGDCLLLDLVNGFFAVADGSDRWPSASSDLLKRLAGRLAAKPRPQDGQGWLREVNKAYGSQRRLRTTTFSGVAVNGTPGARSLTILNGGDSPILLLNLKTKEIEYASPADMNFAGRATGLSRVVELTLGKAPYRLLLASDGLSDLARLRGQTVEALCLWALSRFAVEELPDRIREFLKQRQGKAEYDDIGLIALDPAAVGDFQQGRFLLGGTTPAEEEQFQGLKDKVLRDRWVPAEGGNFSLQTPEEG
jgi:hypothetical protein